MEEGEENLVIKGLIQVENLEMTMISKIKRVHLIISFLS
jgi:hypothetical protein